MCVDLIRFAGAVAVFEGRTIWSRLSFGGLNRSFGPHCRRRLQSGEHLASLAGSEPGLEAIPRRRSHAFCTAGS